MTAARIAELTLWIASISSKKDSTPPAERHHLRNAILPMQRQILRLSGFTGTEEELEIEARKRTIAAVPQRLHSYPMHLREQIMTLNPKHLEKPENGEA